MAPRGLMLQREAVLEITRLVSADELCHCVHSDIWGVLDLPNERIVRFANGKQLQRVLVDFPAVNVLFDSSPENVCVEGIGVELLGVFLPVLFSHDS